MNVKILPEKPLSPLNQIFPEGVPIDGELEVNGSLAYIFNTEGVPCDILKQIAQLATSDNMPFTISAIFLSQCELVIPQQWLEQQPPVKTREEAQERLIRLSKEEESE